MSERLTVGADELTFHVTSAETGGAMLAVEVRLPPGGGPPALHRHAPAEIYRVEHGELAIYVGDERIVAGPGSVTHIPGGTPHNVRNESDAPAHAYVVFSPGTEFEAFVRAVAADPENVIHHAMANGIEFT